MGTGVDTFGQNRPMRRAALTVLLFLVLAGSAQAARVAVIVVPADDPFPTSGAVGLFVPGQGDTASGEVALASLLRGKVEPSVIDGGRPSGKPLISLSTRPAPVTIYVSLPPPGKSSNTRRYPITIVGGGYHGVLTSPSTRIRGLVSIADIAPTAVALERGDRPRILWSADSDPSGTLAKLDQRMTRSHDVRLWATLVLVATVLGGALLAFGYRYEYLGRAGVLAAPAVLAVALLLSAIGVTRPHAVVLLLAAGTIASALAFAVPRKVLPWALVALVLAFLIVFAAWPEIASFAAIGPHPDGGGRFYGAGNLTETVLLTVSLEAAYLLGPRSILPIAALAIVTVGWSRAGADGGGIVVLLAAFATLAVRMTGTTVTVKRALLAALGGVIALAAIVGLDAATGGRSHVTHAFRRGPVSLVEDLAHRVHISASSLASDHLEAVVFGVSIVALVTLATRPPRFPAGEALLVGIAVSLLVNDSPGDVASAGALSYAVLWAYERVREPARDRAPRDTVVVDAPGHSPPA
jgi:hypothetical protein